MTRRRRRRRRFLPSSLRRARRETSTQLDDLDGDRFPQRPLHVRLPCVPPVLHVRALYVRALERLQQPPRVLARRGLPVVDERRRRAQQRVPLGRRARRRRL